MIIPNRPMNTTTKELIKWVEEHAYKPDVDRDDLYYHLCWIAKSFLHQAHYFNSGEREDEEYCSYEAAYYLLERYENPKQFIIDESTGEPLMRKIDDHYKFIRFIIPIAAKKYLRRNLPSNEVLKVKPIKDYLFLDTINSRYDGGISKIEAQVYLENVPKTLKDILDKTPFKKDTLLYHRIYMSCLLTMIGRLSPIIREKNLRTKTVNRELLGSSYHREIEVFMIDLDVSFATYVQILSRECLEAVYSDVSELLNNTVLDVNALTNELWSVVEKKDDEVEYYGD